MIRSFATALALIGTQAHAVDFYFCWEGANGYTMTGQMTVAPEAMSQPLVTESDVTEFRIAGYLDGALIGKWDLAMRDETTPWVLHFDPAGGFFYTPEQVGLGVSQAWNAGGNADDCGNPGFGFNLGNYAQDFCLNGVWIEDSGMPPETPFLVSPTPVSPICEIYAPTS
ncbi:MAG: hypothetical protein ACK4TM_10000 [Yoonia sp.]